MKQEWPCFVRNENGILHDEHLYQIPNTPNIYVYSHFGQRKRKDEKGREGRRITRKGVKVTNSFVSISSKAFTAAMEAESSTGVPNPDSSPIIHDNK